MKSVFRPQKEYFDKLILDAFEPFRGALIAAYEQGRKDEHETVINEIVEPLRSGRPAPDLILKAVTSVTGLSVDQFSMQRGIVSHSRRFAAVRQAAAVLLREECDLSFPVAAQLLGYEDHTSVMYANQVWTQRPEVAALVERIRGALKEAKDVA